MANSYGFIEISGIAAATVALDIMCKAADIQFVTWERKLGGRLVTIIIQGEISAVKEALSAAELNGIKLPVAIGALASPHPEITRLVTQSASKMKGRCSTFGKEIYSQEEGGAEVDGSRKGGFCHMEASRSN